MSPYVDHEPKECGIDYTDPEVLRELYWSEELSLAKVAELAGVSSDTIQYHMEKNEINRRDRIEATKKSKRVEYASFYTDKYGGYEKWSDVDKVYVHRLLAVCEFGFDSVCGMDVHHENGVPWDNRPSNISLMTHGEHTVHHHSGKQVSKKLSKRDVVEIRKSLSDGGLGSMEIASEFGVSYRTILQIKNRDTWDFPDAQPDPNA